MRQHITHAPTQKTSNRGFTIVELLIVIVVIGILVLISTVVYGGVSQRAVVASLQSDLNNSAKKLALYQVDNMAYPLSVTDCATATPATGNICLKASPGNTYDYTPVNNTNPQTFSLTATNTRGVAYMVTNNTAPVSTAAIMVINETFIATGASQSWTVPSGVNSVVVEAWGAQGGNGYGASGSYTGQTGGLGGYVKATLGVIPGQTLYVFVGGVGAYGAANVTAAGGFNGGGNASQSNGNISSYSGGGGGGASDVRVGGSALANRIIVGGGGGGGGSSTGSKGGFGGFSTGGTGYSGTGTLGSAQGGSQTVGGSGGAGTQGSLGIGGVGAYCGPGGGGGYYGGASGGDSCNSGGGGGGSSYAGGLLSAITYTSNVQSNSGKVTISN